MHGQVQLHAVLKGGSVGDDQLEGESLDDARLDEALRREHYRAGQRMKLDLIQRIAVTQGGPNRHFSEFFRYGEHHVEVLDGEQLGFASGHPPVPRGSLAFRTVTIAAGVIGDPHYTAVITLVYVPTQGRGATPLQG
jgi:hypothetical protein